MKYLASLAISLILCLACKQNPSEAADIPNLESKPSQIAVAESIGDKKDLKPIKKELEQEVSIEKEASAPASKPSKERVVKKVETKAPNKNKEETTITKPVQTEKAKEVLIDENPIENKPKVEVKEEPVKVNRPIEKEVETPKEKEIKIPVEETTAAPAFNHDVFNTLLSSYVSSSGKVNYKGLKGEESKLDAYLADLAKNAPAGDWSKNKALAYWINLYNAGTIKLILNNYPVASITDLEGGKPWDKVWIKSGSKTLSLNNIENDIIRPTFNEPRIHFAVNCAAKSCPSLLNKAFTADNLNTLLEQQTVKFINNPAFNAISADKVKVSKIFDWYGKDFGDLKAYLNKYSKVKIGSGTSIEFQEYDWALNE